MSQPVGVHVKIQDQARCCKVLDLWSGRPGSNRRHSAWEDSGQTEIKNLAFQASLSGDADFLGLMCIGSRESLMVFKWCSLLTPRSEALAAGEPFFRRAQFPYSVSTFTVDDTLLFAQSLTFWSTADHWMPADFSFNSRRR